MRRGDTLMNILLRAQIDQAEAHAAVASLRDVYDPRRLRAGQELALTAQSGAEEARRGLLRLAFDLDFDHQIEITRSADGRYDAAKVERPQHRQMVRRAGTIDDSLYLAAARVELPHDVTYGLVKLFSWDVDFQRDVRPGDDFETGVRARVSRRTATAPSRRRSSVRRADTRRAGNFDAYRFEVEDSRSSGTTPTARARGAS